MPSPGPAAVFVLPGSRQGERADQSVCEAGDADGAMPELTPAAIPPAECRRITAECQEDDGRKVPGIALPADSEPSIAIPSARVLNDELSMATAAPVGDGNAAAALPADGTMPPACDEPGVTAAASPIHDGATTAEAAGSGAKSPVRVGLVKHDQVQTPRIAPNYRPHRSNRQVENSALVRCRHRGRDKSGSPKLTFVRPQASVWR